MYTYNEACKYILEIPKFSKKTSVDSLKVLLKEITKEKEIPQIIHVAGTNGKGSVCTYISYVLCEAGYEVGEFVSPHLREMTERIRINNKDVSKECFTNAFNYCIKVIDEIVDMGREEQIKRFGAEVIHPSFFEIIFLMAMYIFANAGVSFIILETGLGGRLDATNCVDKKAVSVITSISLDHMEILGDTIELIAREKAGIIKEYTDVVYYGENPVVSFVMEEEAKKKNAKTHKVTDSMIKSLGEGKYLFTFACGESKEIFLKTKASYQPKNALVALQTLKVLKDKGVADINNENIINGMSKMKWQGRMDEAYKNFFVDGAHNDDGIKEFVKSVNSFKAADRKILIFGAVKEKEYEKMIADICTNTDFSDIYITPVDSPRGLTKEVLFDTFSKYAHNSRIIVCNDSDEAVKRVLNEKNENDVVFCAGSLYLAGNIYESLDKYAKTEGK